MAATMGRRSGDPTNHLLVCKSIEEYELIARDPKDTLRGEANQTLSDRILQQIKFHHDSVHKFDDGYKSDYISDMVIGSGFDDEQAFQQQELQTAAATRCLLETFSTTSIEEAGFGYIRLENRNKMQGKKDKREIELLGKGKKNSSSIDSDDTSDGDSEDSDEELSQIKERIKLRAGGDTDLFNTLDSEDETLFKGAAEEYADEEESDLDDDSATEETENAEQTKQTKKSTVKRKSEVDDKFFKLADMKEFLEREDRREERKQKVTVKKCESGKDAESSEESVDETEDIDMFAKWSDDDTEQDAMYADFFDPLSDEEGMPTNTDSPEASGEEEDDADEEEEENMDEDEEETEQGKKKVTFSKDTKDQGENKKEQQLVSSFQQRSERLLRQITGLEEESLETKSWQLSGEVGASRRPEDSIMEEYLEFDQSAPAAVEVTEEVTQNIEEILIQRIKDKAFDSNQRQVRPTEEVYELKTQRNLDQEKSKLSLHEIYEQEYLRLQASEQDETNPLHEEIKKMMASLFPRLDALASWHYKPTQAVPEVKIRSNLPAIQMEESTPITMANTSVLAPEEVKAKKKRDVKGETERSKEDKRRLRRQKKAAKREKMKEKEKRHKEVEKLNPGLGNKYSKERALKELKKQSTGNLEVIQEKKSKKSMSSKTFFSQLQEEVTTQIKAKTKRVKDKKKQKSSEKFLL